MYDVLHKTGASYSYICFLVIKGKKKKKMIQEQWQDSWPSGALEQSRCQKLQGLFVKPLARRAARLVAE